MKSIFGDGISWDRHVDEVLGEPKVFHDGELDTLEAIAKYMDFSDEPPKLLDCGCHIGRWSRLFTNRGFDYTGIDQSLKAVEIARLHNPQFKFINSFLWDMDFKEEFDAAITVAVLQHNTNKEKLKIIPKVYNALKPSGIFGICESTVATRTNTQLTYEEWIKVFKHFGFKFLESMNVNDEGFDDHYIFQKEECSE